jgi:two-component system OmpR family response regulator
LLRRGVRAEPTTQLQFADLSIDLVSRKVRRERADLELTAREFDLLVFLMRNANQIVSRKVLLEHVWGVNFDPQTNVVDVHMSRLRQAVDKGFERPLIHTVRGVGYQLAL